MSERIGETHDYGLAPGESFEPDLEEESFDLSRPHVMTVLGPVAPEALGFTLHHEHVIAKAPSVGIPDPDLLLDDVNAAIVELEAFHQVGGRAIVDMTPPELGRDVDALRWVAERSPVHLVAITGHYKHTHAAPSIADETTDATAARIIHELTEGIDGTGVKAGVIKAATSLNEIHPVEERVLRAVARAHLATGAPISTHTERGTMALEQIAILSDAGVDPSRVIIGHLDFALDERYLRRVLATGAWVSFDQISKSKYGPAEDRAAMVKTLIDAGHADQLLLSGDLSRRSYWRAYGHDGPGFVSFLERFPITLMEAGLDAPTIRRLFVDNPARALTIRRGG